MPSTFVAPQAEIVEQPAELLTAQTVGAVVLGNAGAGVGLAVVVQTVAMLAGLDALSVAPWALGLGAILFGVLMVVRLGMDEVVAVWQWRQLVASLTDLEQENSLLRERLASAQQDVNLERLQRAAQARTPTPTRVDVFPELNVKRRQDADTLLQRHFMGLSFARDVMVREAQWTPTRWIEAMDLLKAAGIVATNGKRTAIQVQTLTEAMDRLNGIGEE